MKKLISSVISLAMLAGTLASATGVMAAETEAAHSDGVILPNTYETVFDASQISAELKDTKVEDAFTGWSGTWSGTNNDKDDTNVNCITESGKNWLQFYGAANAAAATVSTPKYAEGADWFAIEFVMSASTPGKNQWHCHDTILFDNSGKPFYSYAYADANDGFFPNAGARSFNNEPQPLGASKEGNSTYTNGSSIVRIIVDNDATYDGADAYAVTCVIDDNVISTHYYEGSVNGFGGISDRSINSTVWYWNVRYGDLKVYVGTGDESDMVSVTYKYVYGDDNTEIPSSSLPAGTKMTDYAEPGESYTANGYPTSFRANEGDDLVEYTYNSEKSTVTIGVTEEGFNEVILNYDRTVLPKKEVVVKAVDSATGSDIKTFVSGSYNIDANVSYAYPKYLTDENNKVTYEAEVSTFSGSITVSEDDNANTLTVNYKKYEGDAYFYEFEDMNLNGRVQANESGDQYSSGSERRLAANSYAYTDVLSETENAVYKIEVSGRNVHNAAGYSLYTIDAENNLTDTTKSLDWSNYESFTTKSVEVAVPAGSKLAFYHTPTGWGSNVFVDYVLITKIPAPSATLETAVWASTDDAYSAEHNVLTVNGNEDDVVYGYKAMLVGVDGYSKFNVVATPADTAVGEAKHAELNGPVFTNADVVLYILSNVALDSEKSTVTAVVE